MRGRDLSIQIEALGVTSAASLLGCSRRVELSRAMPTTPSQAVLSIPASLGDLCHEALQRATQSRKILEEDWEKALESSWERAEEALGAYLGGADPRAWPGYKMAQARMRNVGMRLREMILPLGERVELTCEQGMQALGGRLRGKPDLVVLGAGAHWIVDYKTGGVLDFKTQLPKQAYETQLRLYAVLEHERTGAWPSRGFLLPFKQRTVEVPLEEEACTELGRAVGTAIDDFNQWLPGPQPASPAPENCQWCSHPTHCDAVWRASAEDWSPRVQLAEGVLVQSARSRIDLLTIVLELTAGTLGEGLIAIKADPRAVAEDLLAPGARLRVSGLLRKGERTFALAPWGELGASSA